MASSTPTPSAETTPNIILSATELVIRSTPPGGLVSDRVRSTFGVVVGYWVVFFLASLGLVTNSLTMIVFIRQGFRESVNVSLFSIAVWDQIKCLAGVIFRLYGPIGLVDPVWGVIWENGSRTYLVYLPIFAGYVSYGLATYVSIERCLSISMPFKMRFVFSSRLTTRVMVVISALIFTSFSPMFFIYDLKFVYSPHYNTSIIIRTPGNLYYAQDGVILKMYKFLGIFYPAVFCPVMVVSSAVIVFCLKKSAANFNIVSNRAKINTDTTHTATGEISSRDARVTKMLLVVIFVYLMDFFPRLCTYTASLIEPEFFAYGRYHNLMLVMSNSIWVLDFVNASVNFFIFMAMSTSFQRSYYEVFSWCVK
ncbi:multitransmembrane protein [Elysia marginata]|uniref:Multitransmembrane protein n=1 Tax=Elysia marginata TaxID=1093978 RepID=A0AAV4I7X4_9GAST|nr:multitransmembrane protein [Elysia marginata]